MKLLISFILLSIFNSAMAEISCKSTLMQNGRTFEQFYGYDDNRESLACIRANSFCNSKKNSLNRPGRNTYSCFFNDDRRYQKNCKRYLIDSDGRLVKTFSETRTTRDPQEATKTACKDALYNCQQHKTRLGLSYQAKCRSSL